MTSSPKNKGSGKPAPQPQMGTQTGLPNGDTMQYYLNPAQIPQGQTGMVRPPSVPGMMQGAGLNIGTPPPPRMQLAQAMAPQQFQDNYGRGARGMGGAFGNGFGGGRGGNTPGGGYGGGGRRGGGLY